MPGQGSLDFFSTMGTVLVCFLASLSLACSFVPCFCHCCCYCYCYCLLLVLLLVLLLLLLLLLFFFFLLFLLLLPLLFQMLNVGIVGGLSWFWWTSLFVSIIPTTALSSHGQSPGKPLTPRTARLGRTCKQLLKTLGANAGHGKEPTNSHSAPIRQASNGCVT